jgi:hypothetical protein
VDELGRVVGRLAVPPPLAVTGAGSSGHDFQGFPGSDPAPASPDLAVLEQLRTLGDLRTAGVLTEAEFEAEKTELLGRP